MSESKAVALPRLGPTPRSYETLRDTVDEWLSRHTGSRHQAFRSILFLVPDVFTLVLRLAQDSRVPFLSRLKLWGLAAYILSPWDINLDFLFPLGPLDDLALSVLILESVLRDTPQYLLQEHWPGSGETLDRLLGLTSTFRAVRTSRGRAKRRGR